MDSEKNSIIDAMITEYEVLRDEIGRYHDQQKEAINFSLIGIGAFLTAFGTPLIQDTYKYITLLLVLPIFISIAGLLYFDRTVRIKRLASYIHNFLRPKLISKLNHEHLWHWETYKKVTATSKDSTYTIAFLLDRLRLSIFFVPIVLAISAFFYFKGLEFDCMQLSLIVTNATLFILLVYISWEIEETKGASTSKNELFYTTEELSKKEYQMHKDFRKNSDELPDLKSFFLTLIEKVVKYEAQLRTEAINTQIKEGRDIVSSSDISIESFLIKTIKSRYPDHNILTEESLIDKTDSNFLWIIDPIDGTVNYSSSFPFWGISVAVLEKGEAKYGSIVLPPLDLKYLAIKGEGAYCNERLIKCSTKKVLSESLVTVMLTSHYSEEENIRATSIIQKLNMKARGVRVLVCEAAELAFIAEGKLDGNVVIKADAYGVAAGKLLLEEAGGKLTQIDGAKFDYESKTIVASNFGIHQALIDGINEAIQS